MSLKCLKYLQQQGNTMAAVLEHGDVALYEEEQDFFQDIDLLQNHGINVADIKKLKTAGISCFKISGRILRTILRRNINYDYFS